MTCCKVQYKLVEKISYFSLFETFTRGNSVCPRRFLVQLCRVVYLDGKNGIPARVKCTQITTIKIIVI